MTAGWKLAAAVREVQRTAAWVPDALAIPRAQNAADRSSMRTWIPMPGWAAKARAIGVEREPGAMQAWASPLRTSSSTRTVARACPALSAFKAPPHIVPKRPDTGPFGRTFGQG